MMYELVSPFIFMLGEDAENSHYQIGLVLWNTKTMVVDFRCSNPPLFALLAQRLLTHTTHIAM